MTAAAAFERLRASTRPRVLFVAHAFGGGVARHVDTLAAAIADHAEVLLLQPHGEDHVRLAWRATDGEHRLWFRTAQEWERILALLEAIGIDRVHYHHVHGLPRPVLDLPARLGCASDVTLHDYFPACPAYHLTDGRGRYCGGEPDCGRCLEAGPAIWPLGIAAWRAAFGELLRGCARVIAPSQDAARRIRRFFPAISPVVWPHPEHDAPRPTPPMRVLVPGAISPAKGLALLEACVRDAADRRLPLHFRVLGYTAKPIAPWPALPFGVSGEYREGDLGALVALERGDAFFFPAQCPETYSYTLSAALATGLPIVATDLGAFPERLAGRANARIVRWDAPAREMNDVLLAFAKVGEPERDAPPHAMTSAAYRALYLEGLARGPARRGPLPAVDGRWNEEPPLTPPFATLAWLFEDTVLCGRGESREKLRRRAPEADRELEIAAAQRAESEAAIAQSRAELARAEGRAEAFGAELAGTRAERDRLAAAAAALEERIARIEASRSWRITAPLRALARRLRSQA